MTDFDESSRDRVDQIADLYESAWRNGETPQIRAWVARVQEESTRAAIALLRTDVQLRQAEGETPSRDDYVTRLGIEQDLVHTAFFELFGDPDEFDPEAPTIGHASSPSNGDAPLVGSVLDGEFEILETIGRGGMGVVYRARQLALNRIVAVKVVRAGEFALDTEVEQFITEARATARLDHPGIVRVIKSGYVTARQPYYAMEYVEGPTLESLKGQLDQREIARIVEQLAEAIAYAHSEGVVHRDLKPANVMLDEKRQPRILDFGLALLVDVHQTSTIGRVVGSAPNMSPEQAVGSRDVGPPTDVYGLGTILYELLTNRLLFTGSTLFEILHAVTERAPTPPRDVNPSVHRDLEQVCLRCLQKEPKDRYGSAADLAADLRSFRENRPVNGVGWWRIVQALFEPHYQTTESFSTQYTALVLGPIALVLHTAVWGATWLRPDSWSTWTTVYGVGWTALFLATVYMFGRRYWESDYVERMTGMSWIGHWLAHLSVYALVFHLRPHTLDVLREEVYPLLSVTCAALAFSHGAHEGRLILMGLYWFSLSWLMLLVPAVSPLLFGLSTFASLTAVWFMLGARDNGNDAKVDALSEPAGEVA